MLAARADFPDYNSIDSIDTMNVVRFGLRNILQTKRNGQLDDLVNWNLLLDWRLDGPRRDQNNFNDLYSALARSGRVHGSPSNPKFVTTSMAAT